MPQARLSDTTGANPSLSRTQSAWLAYLREELQPLAQEIADGSQLIRQQMKEAAPGDFHEVAETLARHSGDLLRLITDLPITETTARSSSETKESLRTLQHTFGNKLSQVLGACDEGLEVAPAEQLNRLVPDLTRIHDRSRELLARIKRLVAFRLGLLPGAAQLDPHLEEVRRKLEQLAPPDRHATSLDSQNGHLLLVDDNEADRRRMADTLRREGHEVTEFGSGREALALVAQDAGRFDAVLLDLVMPDMHGLEVLLQLKSVEASRHLPVVVISARDASDDDPVLINCIAGGAEDYLIRPVPPELLRARIGACLEKKRLRDRERSHLQRIDDLLHAIIPAEFVPALTKHGRIESRLYTNVGVLFLDIVKFTVFCQNTPADEVVRRLDGQVRAFEQITHRHGVQKIKTIGDAFMATAGLPKPCPDPVLRLLRCGVDLIDAARTGPLGLPVRIGIHVGEVVAGQLGEKQFTFDLWGPTVNLASRMESSGSVNRITLSQEAWEQVEPFCISEKRDAAVRNVGRLEVYDFVAFRELQGHDR